MRSSAVDFKKRSVCRNSGKRDIKVTGVYANVKFCLYSCSDSMYLEADTVALLYLRGSSYIQFVVQNNK